MTLTEAVIGDFLAEADDMADDELVASGLGLAALALWGGADIEAVTQQCVVAMRMEAEMV